MSTELVGIYNSFGCLHFFLLRCLELSHSNLHRTPIQNDTFVESNWLPLDRKSLVFPDLKMFACHELQRKEPFGSALVLAAISPSCSLSSSLSPSCTAICSEWLEISWHKLLPCSAESGCVAPRNKLQAYFPWGRFSTCVLLFWAVPGEHPWCFPAAAPCYQTLCWCLLAEESQ